MGSAQQRERTHPGREFNTHIQEKANISLEGKSSWLNIRDFETPGSVYLSKRRILGDIRLWVGDPSTCSCLVSLPRITPGCKLANPSTFGVDALCQLMGGNGSTARFEQE